MNGDRIRFEHRLVYLGVIIDMHLSWMPHLTAVQKRAYNLVHKMDRLTASNRGIKPKLRKMLFQVVAESIILYAVFI